MEICNYKDCLLHPENPHNHTIQQTYNNLTYIPDTLKYENNTLQIGNVAFRTNNNISELIIELKNYNIEIPVECLFCNKRKEIDMQSEVYKRRAKSLLKE